MFLKRKYSFRGDQGQGALAVLMVEEGKSTNIFFLKNGVQNVRDFRKNKYFFSICSTKSQGYWGWSWRKFPRKSARFLWLPVRKKITFVKCHKKINPTIETSCHYQNMKRTDTTMYKIKRNLHDKRTSYSTFNLVREYMRLVFIF